jgi:phosphatidylglycerophosphatase A
MSAPGERAPAGARVNPLVRALATLGPAGYAPVAPATAGSAVVALAGWFIPPPALPVTLGLIALGAALAVWLAGEAEKELGHDAKPIVVDEAVGQSLALLFVPHHWAAFVAAFLLFRVFDVWKPLGAREAQALPGGLGIVADDVIAGLVSCGVFHLGWWGLRAAGLLG